MSGLHPGQFQALIINETLYTLDLFSPAASDLLLGTALQESRLKYLKQLGGGPALGPYQMESDTHDDIWANYLDYRPHLAKVLQDMVSTLSAMQMVGNMYYATAMARIHYLRKKEALPEEGDILGMASYWKRYYNTHLGAGTEMEFVRNWERMTWQK